jgi:transcriptional regulator with XRE-family HTH domain
MDSSNLDNPIMDITEIISRNLSAWMAENPSLGTLEKVSERSGVGYGTVRRAKTGSGNTTANNLEDIARAFGRSAADIVSETDVAPKPAEVVDLVKTVDALTSSGKLSAAEIRAMTDMLKARDV